MSKLGENHAGICCQHLRLGSLILPANAAKNFNER